MLKKSDFENDFEEYESNLVESGIDSYDYDEEDDNEVSLDNEKSDEDGKENFENETLPSYSINIRRNNQEVANQDLRLVNAYFQEVSTETLLTPLEEIQVAAKIRCCESGARTEKKNMEAVLGKSLPADTERLSEVVVDILESMSAEKKAGSSPDYKNLRILFGRHEAFVQKGMQLRNRFIKANLRLVASMAKRFVGRGVPFLDLIQEGNLGLIKAVERFDHSKGYRFSTYACWWINQAMTRGIFNHTRTVKLPAYLLEKAGKVRHVKRMLAEKKQREPSVEEIAENAQVSVENVKRILESGTNRTVRLDTPVWDGEKVTYMDYIEDSNSIQVDSMIAEVSIPDNINHALLRLDVREREVVKMRFGIGYENPYTLDEIGKKFRLTRERIRQIEKKALDRIRRSKSAPVLSSLMDVYNN